MTTDYQDYQRAAQHQHDDTEQQLNEGELILALMDAQDYTHMINADVSTALHYIRNNSADLLKMIEGYMPNQREQQRASSALSQMSEIGQHALKQQRELVRALHAAIELATTLKQQRDQLARDYADLHNAVVRADPAHPAIAELVEIVREYL